MYRTESVLALLALYAGLVHSFSWDVVVAGEEQLEFYDNNGTRTHVEHIPSYFIPSIVYDPVHDRVLFVDLALNYFSISSFNIATRKKQLLFKRNEHPDVRIAYDPATQLLFWAETGPGSKNSIFSKPGYTNEIEQNLLIKLDGDEIIHCITVDSCEGCIYWSTNSKIERARFDGSEREVVIDKKVRYRGGITIDNHTQKMYWIDNVYYGVRDQMSIESANLNGENRKTLYIEREILSYGALLVSKDFIYWRTQDTFSQLTRNPPHDKEVKPKQFLLAQRSPPIGMASNYKIEDQSQGIQNCKAQKSPRDSASLSVSTDASLLCVHGTTVSGESRCECTQGYIGERCEVSVCHNYCFQGECSVSAEGQPKCRCKPGYSGERCEVNACHEYCLNNGVCSLNEKSEPVCQCTGDYQGTRCDVPIFLVKCLQTFSLLRDILNTDVTPLTLGKGVKSTCASTVV